MALELEYPIHRLNSPQTRLWLISVEARRAMAANFAKRYPTGVGILSATLRLFALVNPRGGIRELPPPHQEFKMWQVANRPIAITECPCADFFDPEVQGPWKERGTSAGHHPFCQFDRSAESVFNQAARSARSRRAEGRSAQTRPDEWKRLQDAEKAS